MEHCISSVQRMMEEKRYKEYITDCLKSIIEMYYNSHGITVELPRFTEPVKTEPEETAEEIIARITEGLTHTGN